MGCPHLLASWGTAPLVLATLTAADQWALFSLAVGVAIVLLFITRLHVGAFLALISAALVVSMMSDGNWDTKATRVAESFGVKAGGLTILIASAAIIGKTMMDSGAAERIVIALLRGFGERRAPYAMMTSGFVLSIPVFFDTVFYLLVPLARSMHQKTGKDYLFYILAIAAGGVVTHTMVPPTPGPLMVAEQLNVSIVTMMLMGTVVGLPVSLLGMLYCAYLQRMMPIPMRIADEDQLPGAPEELDEIDNKLPDGRPLPPLVVAWLPILVPLTLMAGGQMVSTAVQSAVKSERAAWVATAVAGTEFTPSDSLQRLVDLNRYVLFACDKNVAMLLAAAISMLVYYRQRKPTGEQFSHSIEASLLSGGLVILITAAGGAFGDMLKLANVGVAIQHLFGDSDSAYMLLVIAFTVASLLKIAQGSSTVAMTTTVGMVGAMLPVDAPLAFHPVYLCLSIGFGSLVGSWMNDSGYWIFTRMGGLTETESLKTWTTLLAMMGVLGFIFTYALATLIPAPRAPDTTTKASTAAAWNCVTPRDSQA